MNIHIYNHYAITPNFPGGTRHFDLAEYLAKKGHKVNIIASSFHYSLMKETKNYRKNFFINENIENISFIWIKTFPYKGNDWKRLLNMFSYSINAYRIKNKFERPDVIIGSTVHPFAAYAASIIAKQKQIPFVFEIRDLWPQTFIDMGMWEDKDVKSLIFKKIESNTVKNAKSIIALSPLTEEYILKNYPFFNGEIYYIPNGVDLERFDKLSKNNNISHSTFNYLKKLKQEGKLIYLFAGAIVKSNNLDILLKVSELLKKKNVHNIHLVLIGKGEYEKQLRKEIKKRALEKFISILEPVSKRKIPILLKMADILLLIQGKVMWGSMNKLFDYMAAAKPIIVSSYAEHNNPFSFLDNEFYIPPNNETKLTEMIIKTSKMTKREKTEIGLKLRKYVEKHHSINILGEELEKALKLAVEK